MDVMKVTKPVIMVVSIVFALGVLSIMFYQCFIYKG